MSENQQQGFKRINFFKGFLTTEKDWNDAERYHIDKRRLHNRMMHSPGIVYGYAGDLRVTARARGDLSVEVQPLPAAQIAASPYQRILLLSQRLSTQEKRADLTELTVTGGTNSINHAVFGLHLWAAEGKTP